MTSLFSDEARTNLSKQLPNGLKEGLVSPTLSTRKKSLADKPLMNSVAVRRANVEYDPVILPLISMRITACFSPNTVLIYLNGRIKQQWKNNNG